MKFIDNHRYKRIAHSADVYNKLIVSIPPPPYIHDRPRNCGANLVRIVATAYLLFDFFPASGTLPLARLCCCI